MIDLNITKIIDSRSKSHYQAFPAQQYYPSRSYATFNMGKAYVKVTKDYSGGIEVGLTDDPLPLKITINENISHSIVLTAYRNWEDFSVISVEDLRSLGQILMNAAQNGENVLVHCAGGIGRTGTLTTYVQVKSVIDMSAHPLSDEQRFMMVEDQIFANRQDRKQGSVETLARFHLILLKSIGVHTLKLPDPALRLNTDDSKYYFLKFKTAG